jgi:hypothetical protein
VEFRSDGGEQSKRLSLVELRAPEGPNGIAAIASIALAGTSAADVKTGGLATKAPLPAMTDYALMREELAIPGRDPVFESALSGAAKLALS